LPARDRGDAKVRDLRERGVNANMQGQHNEQIMESGFHGISFFGEHDGKSLDEGAKMLFAREPTCFSCKVVLLRLVMSEPFTAHSLAHIFNIVSIHVFAY
jgi:hypothetical protein